MISIKYIFQANILRHKTLREMKDKKRMVILLRDRNNILNIYLTNKMKDLYIAAEIQSKVW